MSDMPQTVICVGAAVLKDHAILVVRQSKGHSLEGRWTIPWGRLEPGESPADAAMREVREESGVVASIDGLVGIQELPDPWRGWIAILYQCAHTEGTPTPDHRETDAARYLTLQQIDLLDEPVEPWSEWFMRRVLTGHCTVIPAAPQNPFSPEAGFI